MKTLDEVAASLQGYDPQALQADTAKAFLQTLVNPVPQTETVALKAALGRVLAADVVSPINVPAHDNSAMDGYAFDGELLQAGQALQLEIAGTALAGKAWSGSIGHDQCLKIMTGAVMPAGLDTVVPQELVSASATHITIPAGALRQGDNRRFKGEDLCQGKPALRAGASLGPAALGLLASLNIAQVEVRRPLRVAFFSTGDEILSLGESPREGAVYDSNRYTLYGLLTRMGVEPLDMGVVRDDPVALEAAFTQAAAQADAIITSGGVSVGEADHTNAENGGRPLGRCLLENCHAPRTPHGGGAHRLRRSVWSAGQPGGRHGDLPGFCTPHAAAHDGPRGRDASYAQGP